MSCTNCLPSHRKNNESSIITRYHATVLTGTVQANDIISRANVSRSLIMQLLYYFVGNTETRNIKIRNIKYF